MRGGVPDFGAEPAIGQRFAPTRWRVNPRRGAGLAGLPLDPAAIACHMQRA